VLLAVDFPFEVVFSFFDVCLVVVSLLLVELVFVGVDEVDNVGKSPNKLPPQDDPFAVG
jgi:hypothetical protein